MKKLLSLMLLSLSLGFVACGGDDDNGGGSNGKYDKTDFQGEWVAVEGNMATYYNFGPASFEGYVYTNLTTTPTRYEDLTGTWAYYGSNEVLQLSIQHSKTLQQATNSYTIRSKGSYSMVLREQSTGAEDTFYKYIGDAELKEGAQQAISYATADFTPVAYGTSNSNIVTVDNQGRVTAVSQGVAFISIYSDTDVVIAKVEVIGRVKTFVEELDLSIDQVIAAHGTPDVEGDLDDMGEKKGIVYRNPSFAPVLNSVQYEYRAATRQLTRILTRYGSAAGWQPDADYVKANYYQDDNLYMPVPKITNTPYVISPFEKDGYFITYLKVEADD